jgi:hypothetical protein
MTKQRVVVQDLNKAEMPTITEMNVTSITSITGNLLRFEHEDGTATIINIAPGWNVYVEEDED